jgi:hypothetical protein
MKRTIVVAAAAVAVVAAGAVTAAVLRHQISDGTGSAGRSMQQRAEDTFLGATAAHLCNVQFTVYDDPKSLADAYLAVPEYPGLTADQVTRFKQRLGTDVQFSTRLTRQLETACRPAAAR